MVPWLMVCSQWSSITVTTCRNATNVSQDVTKGYKDVTKSSLLRDGGQATRLAKIRASRVASAHGWLSLRARACLLR